MSNLVLIIDSSVAFLRSKTKEIYQEWGFTRDRVKEKSEWQFTQSAPSLFGDTLMSHLDLTDKKNLKTFADLISQRKTMEAFTGEWYGNGLIITATNAQGTKKIENLVKKSGGRVIAKAKAKPRKTELLKTVSLSTQAKFAVDQFVGEDYELLLSFVDSVKELPVEKQRSLSPEEALTYFPPTPGSVLPWEFLTALTNGNTAQAISLFDRTIVNSHILVPMTLLNSKMQKLFRVKIAMAEGYTTPAQIAKATGEKAGFELTTLVSLARKVTPIGAERIAKIVTQLESDLKGGSQADGVDLFHIALTQIGSLIN